jgi:2-polyprenyl-3-methyl-5-hydroxy-6-metoxy-1,4-benzoquinol methylase
MDYININKTSWNNRLESHLNSDFYDLKGFQSGACSLKPIELELLGDIKGKKILHLQCHFGQDSISLARRGAIVTGIDLSDKAIEKANELAEEEKTLDVQFICCNLYDLTQHLDDEFDLIFTSYGTIGWLPDLNAWATLIQKYLKPSGRFVFVEFHPFVWTFDDNFKAISYDYFKSQPIIETETGTYADREAAIEQSYVCWNHGLSEVFQALLKHGFVINNFKEYDYSPYPCFKNVCEKKKGQFTIKHLPYSIPMVYSIVAVKAS